MKKALLSLSVAVGSVSIALAQTGTVNGSSLLQLLALAQTLLNRLIPFFIGLAVLGFFWFLIQFIWKGSADATKRAESLKGMGAAILALFVMVSIWGIIGFVANITGIGQGGTVPTPGIPSPCPVGAVTC